MLRYFLEILLRSLINVCWGTYVILLPVPKTRFYYLFSALLVWKSENKIFGFVHCFEKIYKNYVRYFGSWRCLRPQEERKCDPSEVPVKYRCFLFLGAISLYPKTGMGRSDDNRFILLSSVSICISRSIIFSNRSISRDSRTHVYINSIYSK